jgi:hypothetical protein
MNHSTRRHQNLNERQEKILFRESNDVVALRRLT